MKLFLMCGEKIGITNQLNTEHISSDSDCGH